VICCGEWVLCGGVYLGLVIFLKKRHIETDDGKCGTDQNKDEQKDFHLSPYGQVVRKNKELGLQYDNEVITIGKGSLRQQQRGLLRCRSDGRRR
jgi:hypothetical protein